MNRGVSFVILLTELIVIFSHISAQRFLILKGQSRDLRGNLFQKSWAKKMSHLSPKVDTLELNDTRRFFFGGRLLKRGLGIE